MPIHAPASAASGPAALPALRPHPNLYQINTWVWLDRLAAELGRPVTLGSVPDSVWDELARFGFDLVYLMGLWQRSPLGRQVARTYRPLFDDYHRALPEWQLEDVVGSPFSVQAYQPDPHVGTWDDLDAARRKLHARGMRLIADFVPNHTGLDHGWVKAHPEYYVQGQIEEFRRRPDDFFLVEHQGRCHILACGRDPHFPPWVDTAQLNYFEPALRQAMLAELGRIAAHVDGLRCDMAMLILNDRFAATWGQQLRGSSTRPSEEFWSEAIAAYPALVWIAEVYSDMEYRLQQLGFHYTYDKKLYDRLRHASPRSVYEHLLADWDFQRRSVRFLENHDEPRAASVFGRERARALATMLATLPGMRFFHDGQLEGRTRRIPVQLARADPEAPAAEVRQLYERVLLATAADDFHHGQWTLLTPHHCGDDAYTQLLPHLWQHEGRTSLAVINLGARPASARIPVPGGALPAAQLVLIDILNGQEYPREQAELTGEGLYVRLEPHCAHLFAIRPRENV